MSTHALMSKSSEVDPSMLQNQDDAILETIHSKSLQLNQITECLSVLGRNPFTQAHIYTTLTLTDLHLSDIDAIKDFSHLQHLLCSQNHLRSLSPLKFLPFLLTLDATENHLTEVLDFKVPKCCPTTAWENGSRWIGSLLRKATLDKNQIVAMPRYELAHTHPFLLELRLAHNKITEISGVSQLRFLRLLDLSHNKVTTIGGLIRNEDLPHGLQALETLLLSHNQLTTIDTSLAQLPRLTHLAFAHNQLMTLSNLDNCSHLQRLDLAHNNIIDINELTVLAKLRELKNLSLDGNPFAADQLSRTLYRARVLRRVLQIEKLDNDVVTSKEKVKALVMHGSDLEARRQVALKYLPHQEFLNFLYVPIQIAILLYQYLMFTRRPPITDFEDEKLLDL